MLGDAILSPGAWFSPGDRSVMRVLSAGGEVDPHEDFGGEVRRSFFCKARVFLFHVGSSILWHLLPCVLWNGKLVLRIFYT